MPLAPGSRIGHYEVLAPLGAGGMGEVYRARDARLDRSVAIKSLAHAFAADPERRARLEREAKLLASLAHPNVAGIHGLEDVDGEPYLVLEFVDGETLAQRLARGVLTVRETLDLGVQIASAIEAAHERGIVHRDLKPGNVMLTPTHVVKVLDFGLAKGLEAESVASPMLSNSPTRALSATGAGVILGTAPYMSPEQARGKGVDRRTDVWAFGCVLFECLTGRQAFAGETVSDVIARILERDPDWSALPPAMPPRLRDLVRRCLTKDEAERPRDIGDLRRELSAIAIDLSSPGMAVRSVPSAPSLAVLYFQNLGKDAESDYFCAGITEDILTDLSKIKGLRVASRNAVARFRDTPTDAATVAAQLGVGAVLEGSVRRAGDRVRITAQLVNGSDGFHLWAERYDRTLQDVFAVQEEIASAITEALRVALSPAETSNLVRDRPSDARAYDLYLKGREQYGHYSEESLRAALDLFQQAIAIDPSYALAWAGVADTYGQMVQWAGTDAPPELIRLGLEAAHRAIEINPRLPEAHKAEALVLQMSGDTAGSLAALTRAIEANPRFTPALVNLGVERFRAADVAGAERFMRTTLEIDPQEPFALVWLGLLLKLTGRSQEMRAVAERLRRASDDPLYVTASHAFRCWAALVENDVDGAERSLREGLTDRVEAGVLDATAAMIAVRTGRIDEARRLLAGLEGRMLRAGLSSQAAAAALHLGDVPLAIQLLLTGGMRDLTPTLGRLDPELHAVVDHPPFAPRRRDAVLVWPLEAPMMDPATHALFREVRIESAMPRGSDSSH